MRLFRRRPRITEDNYGRLMTSFGRVVDMDRFLAGPAHSLAQRVLGEFDSTGDALDSRMYSGSAQYHLRLLAGSWIMAQEGTVPHATAEVFEEAVIWRFESLVRGSGRLPKRVGELARGQFRREL